MRPGESKGITEEMRFIAMKLREKKPKVKNQKSNVDHGGIDASDDDNADSEVEGGVNDDDVDWIPDLDGFLKYLVESRFVFSTVERLVDESQDVSCKFFTTFHMNFISYIFFVAY